MHVYSNTSIVNPVAHVEPAHERPVKPLMRDMIGHALLIRPLAIRSITTLRGFPSHNRRTVIIADVFDLNDDALRKNVAVFYIPVIKSLIPALETGRIVGGVLNATTVDEFGAPPRKTTLLTELPEHLIPDAAAKAEELGWDKVPNYDAAVGSVIRDMRVSQKMSQATVAEHLNLVVSGVSDIENGYRAITMNTLYALADLFGVSPAKLLI